MHRFLHLNKLDGWASYKLIFLDFFQCLSSVEKDTLPSLEGQEHTVFLSLEDNVL